MKLKKKGLSVILYEIVYFIHKKIQSVNSSKIFAGLIVILLNISSRFVTLRLSKTMESYLKYTLSRDLLIFCIVWMGSRDVYIAAIFTLLFTFIVDYLCNEESVFCILPLHFTEYHTSMLPPTVDEITNAKNVLKRSEEMEKKKESIENNNQRQQTQKG